MSDNEQDQGEEEKRIRSLFREASAVAFGGRISSVESGRPGSGRIATNTNLVAPGLSSALGAGGGRAVSRTAGPIDFEVQGLGFGSLRGGDTEVYDRLVDDQLLIYARAQIQGLRLGLDTRFHLELAETEIVSIFKHGEEDPSFQLRRAVAHEIEFAGKAIKVSFWNDMPETHDDLLDFLGIVEGEGAWEGGNEKAKLEAKAKAKSNPDVVKKAAVRKAAAKSFGGGDGRVIRHREGYVEFHAVGGEIKFDGPTKANQVKLTNFGTVDFGIVQATEYSRRFVLARFKLGCPGGGDADISDVSSGGKG